MSERNEMQEPSARNGLKLNAEDRSERPHVPTGLGPGRMAAVAAGSALTFGLILFLLRGSRDPNVFFEHLGSFTGTSAMFGGVVGYLGTPRTGLWKVLAIIACLSFGLKALAQAFFMLRL